MTAIDLDITSRKLHFNTPLDDCYLEYKRLGGDKSWLKTVRIRGTECIPQVQLSLSCTIVLLLPHIQAFDLPVYYVYAGMPFDASRRALRFLPSLGGMRSVK